MNNEPITFTISVITIAFLVLGLLIAIFLPIAYLIVKSDERTKEQIDFQNRINQHVSKINELLDIDDELGPIQVLNLNNIEQIHLPVEELKELYESMLIEALDQNTPEGYRLAAILRDTLDELK